MDDLTARLEAVLRLYAAACDQGQLDSAHLLEQLHGDLQGLIADYGYDTVEATLGACPGNGPSG